VIPIIRCVAAFAVLLLAPFLCAAGEYSIRGVGPVGGQTFGFAIDANGNIAGQTHGATPPFGSTPPDHAFVYQSLTNQLIDLGTLGGQTSRANAINAVSGVAGDADLSLSGLHGFLYNGSMHDVGDFGGIKLSTGDGINASGVIVGASAVSGTSSHAFWWTSGGPLHDLGTLGGDSSGALAINDAGQIVGTAGITPGSGTRHAFLYDSTMHDLGTLGGANSEGRAISSNGLVVGVSDSATAALQPYLYDGSMHAIPLLAGASGGIAIGVNSGGTVVGVYYRTAIGSGPFVYDPVHGMRDLNSLIPPSLGWNIENATGINNAGQIVGYGVHNGTEQAFILTPLSVPEPSTMVLLAAALGSWLGVQTVSALRRRRGQQ
jgi:probable HAF family extracellular repeat protein